MKRFSALFTCTTLILLTMTGCQYFGSNEQTAEEPASTTIDPDAKPTPDSIEISAAVKSNLIGEIAPDFELQGDDGKTHKLSDYKGQWVILYFYPKDDTPGCTCQANEFTQHKDAFTAAKATIIGVSPDSIQSHNAFREKHNIGVTLLSDPSHEMMKSYQAWGKVGDKERTTRSTFIISPEGQIAFHYPKVVAEGHAARVLNHLKSIQK